MNIKENTSEKKININGIGKLLISNYILIFLAVLIIASALASSNFLTNLNLTNVLRQYSAAAIMALGMLLVILTGGIDLSIGSIVAFTNVVCAILIVNSGLGLFIAIAVSLLVGLVCGAVSGYLISYRNVAPFIATLAMMSIASSFAFILTAGSNIAIRHEGFVNFGKSYIFSFPGFLGIPNQVVIMIFIVIIIYILQKFTSFGRLVTAVGSNEEAVRLSGVDTRIIKFTAYCLSGLFASIGGILLLTRSAVGTGRVGMGFELDAIAACVIGGASLSGGKGTTLKTVAGVFVLALIGNIMNLLNVPSYPQDVIKGVIIIIAVLFQNLKKQ